MIVCRQSSLSSQQDSLAGQRWVKRVPAPEYPGKSRQKESRHLTGSGSTPRYRTGRTCNLSRGVRWIAVRLGSFSCRLMQVSLLLKQRIRLIMPATVISGNGKGIGEAQAALYSMYSMSLPNLGVYVDVVERISTAYWCVFGSVGAVSPPPTSCGCPYPHATSRTRKRLMGTGYSDNN